MDRKYVESRTIRDIYLILQWELSGRIGPKKPKTRLIKGRLKWE